MGTLQGHRHYIVGQLPAVRHAKRRSDAIHEGELVDNQGILDNVPVAQHSDYATEARYHCLVQEELKRPILVAEADEGDILLCVVDMLDPLMPQADFALLVAEEGKTGRDFVLSVLYNRSVRILREEAFELRHRKCPLEPQDIHIHGFEPGTFLLELLP
ncbi:MAG TPA: hypothetical protein VF026_06365 [Ktedonobacteraceae bacterium]